MKQNDQKSKADVRVRQPDSSAQPQVEGGLPEGLWRPGSALANIDQLLPAQKQQLLRQVGATHGNRYVQRVIETSKTPVSLDRPPVALPNQRTQVHIQRFEAQHHEHVERAALTGGGSAGFTDAEATATYFGNWSRDLSQAFSHNPVVEAFGKEMVFEILNVIAMQKFGRALSPRDFGIYSAREHIDSPAGQTNYDLLRGAQERRFAQFGDDQQPQNAEEDISSPQAVAELYAVNDAGLPAYLGRSIQYVEEEFTQAADLGRTQDGLMHFGNGLHTCEDLYAHSNYIEIAVGKLIQDRAIPLPPRAKQEVRERTNPSDPAQALDPIENFAATTTGGRPIIVTGTFTATDTLISLSEAITAFMSEFDPFAAGNQARSEQTMTLILGRYEELASSGGLDAVIRSFMSSFGTALQERLGRMLREAVAGEAPAANASIFDRAIASGRRLAASAAGAGLNLAGNLMNADWVQGAISAGATALGQLPLVEGYRFLMDKKNRISDWFKGLDQQLRRYPFYQALRSYVAEMKTALKDAIRPVIQAAVGFVGQLLQKAFAQSTAASTNINEQIRSQIEAKVQDEDARNQILNASPEIQRQLINDPRWRARAQLSASDLERLRQMIMSPDYVRAGPSHSQIGKDHADSPFFGTAASLAIVADREIRNRMIRVWQSEGRNEVVLTGEYGSEIPDDIRGRRAPAGTHRDEMTPEQSQAEDEAAGAAYHYREIRSREEGEQLEREGALEEGEHDHGVVDAYETAARTVRQTAAVLEQQADNLVLLAAQIENRAPEAARQLRQLAEELPAGIDEILHQADHVMTMIGAQQLRAQMRRLAAAKDAMVSRVQSVLTSVAATIESYAPDVARGLRQAAGVVGPILPIIGHALRQIADGILERAHVRIRTHEQIETIHNTKVATQEWSPTLAASHGKGAMANGQRQAVSPQRQALFDFVRQQIFAHPYDSDWWRPTLINWCRNNQERLADYIHARNDEQMHHHQ